MLLLLFSLGSLASATKQMSIPPVQIEEAIKMAREHVKAHEIDVAGRHIGSAQFRNNRNEEEASYWFITWELDDNIDAEVLTAGGQVFVTVYLDDRIQVTYGE